MLEQVIFIVIFKLAILVFWGIMLLELVAIGTLLKVEWSILAPICIVTIGGLTTGLRLVSGLTITPVSIWGLFEIRLSLVQIELLSQASIEFAETFLIFFIEEDSFDVTIIVKPLVKFVEQVQLHVATFCLWGTPVAIVYAHD